MSGDEYKEEIKFLNIKINNKYYDSWVKVKVEINPFKYLIFKVELIYFCLYLYALLNLYLLLFSN